jgi:hypothetical protein
LAHGKVWRINSDKFREIVLTSSTKKEILRKLNLRAAGGNFGTLTARLIREGLLEGLKTRTESFLIECNKKILAKKRMPLEKILIDGSNYSGNRLKKRLIKNGMLKNECCLCKIGPEWNGKELILQLDHVNGRHNDNRIENLRILCPNCHSQTETYVGRAMLGKGGFNTKGAKCVKCGNPASKKSKSGLCIICYNFMRRKVVRPEKEQLKLFVGQFGFRAAGRKYGVSDNSIRNWIDK